jgi:hypothetical protein
LIIDDLQNKSYIKHVNFFKLMDTKTLSMILIVIGVIAIGILPFIEQIHTRMSNRQSVLEQRCRDIRSAMIDATNMWESARVFLSLQAILSRVSAEQKEIDDNWEQYQHYIRNAMTYAYNAVHENAETAEELEAAKQDHEKIGLPEDNTVNRLREKYQAYQERGIERSNQIHSKIINLDSSISRLLVWKMSLNIGGLIFNVVGLALGIRAASML